MLRCDEGDIDLFFDSADCLSPQQELACDKFDYQVWLNEPGRVKERRQRFLHEMGFADTCSKNRMSECSGAVSSDDQVGDELVFSGGNTACDADDLFDELKGRPENNAEEAYEHFSFAPGIRLTEAEAREEHVDFDMGIKKRHKWWNWFVNSKKVGGEEVKPHQS
ncbi:hypothetical protein L6164_025028 [Bauhinia variegata]|uniref:Uncharacterized protein n=1 Tax=Bauhinia variegata TaxID=167791 RepID=A0ACB9M0P4_BAUVA|nr:hypothetical protein L6164_025028 [Bauhinia variegata]